LAGRGRSFLIDASVFPGNSGGPVVLQPYANSILGTSPRHRAAVVGLVSSYVPYRDVAISVQTKRPRVIFEENSGLAEVVPIDAVDEAVAAHMKTLQTSDESAETTTIDPHDA
jgi:hypothetical protein